MPSSTLLSYTLPAARWTDALPVGNGRLGAMCFGGTRHDRLQLNDDTCWSGSPATTAGDPLIGDDDCAVVLADVRAALARGATAEAEAYVRLFQHGHSQSYQPLVDVWLDDDRATTDPSGYRRTLDLGDAVAAHTWVVDGVRLHQEVFASAPAGVLVVRRWADGDGELAVTVRMSSAHPTAVIAAAGRDVRAVVRMPSQVFPPHEGVLKPVEYATEHAGSAVSAVVGVRVLTDGTARALDGCIEVTAAHEVVLLVATATDFAGPEIDPDGDLAALQARVGSRLDTVEHRTVDELRAAHVADHRGLFDRVALDLGTDPEREVLDTDERLRRHADDGGDPGLTALLVQYGRYLMIAGSRPGSLPLNLQGIWNENVRPVWSSNYTTNINLEMNYWLAEPANLAECAQPLHAWIVGLAVTGERTARTLYGTAGWAAHHNSDAWGFSLPAGEGDGDPSWTAWPMAGTWLCLHLWEHFAFTRDVEFLAERAWPLMQGSARFCLDWLVELPDGTLGTSPSTSPENKFMLPSGASAALSVSTTSDIALMRELFTHCLTTIDLLGERAADLGLRARIAAALDRLPPYRLLPDGRLAEWSTDVVEAEPTHRHHSHLIGLHPGTQIDPISTPELADAARRSLAARGPRSTGWSLAWRLCLHARLFDAAGAVRSLQSFMAPMADDASEEPSMTAPAGLYRNLFCAHPPFQIDGNFGFVAGVVEMLLQSHRDELHLLPCLPAEWSTGEVRGLRARGGITVDIAWCDARLVRARLVADRATRVTVRLGGERVEVELAAGEAVELCAADLVGAST